MQEGLQPSLIALFNAASSLALEVLLFCIDFSTVVADALALNQVDALAINQSILHFRLTWGFWG